MKGMSEMAICFLKPTNVNDRNEKPLDAEGLSLRGYLKGELQRGYLSLATGCATLPDVLVITTLTLNFLLTFCSWFPGSFTCHQSITTSLSR